MNQHKILVLLSVVSTVILLGGLIGLLSGKISAVTSGYKMMMAETAGVRYSFEYPEEYTEFSQPYDHRTYLILGHPTSNIPGLLVDRAIQIHAGPVDKFNPDVTTTVDRLVETENGFRMSTQSVEFHLFERVPITIGKIRGEMVKYSSSASQEFGFSREVYWQRNGLIWSLKLQMNSGPESVGNWLEFEHILQTFRFMN